MSDWPLRTVGDLVTLQRGHDLPGGERRQGDVPIIGSFGVTGWHDTALYKGPGVALGRSGASIGVATYVREDYWPLNTCLFVKDFHGNNERFAYYFLKTLDFVTLNTGSAQPSLNRNVVHPLPVRFPADVTEQIAIAGILGALDDKIDLNKRTNETLEGLARAIFLDWFVDFGPTRAKAEGLPAYLGPEMWTLFPGVFDDQRIPQGWRMGELQKICDLNPKEPLPGGTIAPYLDMASLPTSGSIPDAPVDREFTSGMRFRNGDTLLARITPCLENGKTAFIQNLPNEAIGWGSTEFIVLRPLPPVPKPYGYILAREPDFRAKAIQSMTGTSGRQRARTEVLAQHPVAIPKNEIWKAFGAIVEPMFDRIKVAGEETETLAHLRDVLLPKLMSGEIRLKDAEKKIEEVL